MKLIKALQFVLCALLALALPLTAWAEGAAPDTELEGYVTELVEGGFLMEDKELGQVMLNVDDQTVRDGVLMEKEIEAGQYVIVTYDGKLTRSLPPQAHADKVGCYVLQGTVGDFLDTGVMLMNDEIFGDVLVHVGGNAKHIYPGVPITVYYDGVMAMSLPGQVAAREILVPELSGAVSDLDDQGFTLTDAEGTAYRVLIAEDTLIGELVAADGEVETLNAEAAEQASTEGEGKVDGDVAEEAEGETAEEASEGEKAADDEAPSDAPEGATEGLVEGFETINYARALVEGDQVTVYYDGTLIEAEGKVPQATALEVLAVLARE